MVTHSTHHTLAVCFSPTASHGKILSDCVSCCATAKLGRQTLTIGNVNCRRRVEKACLLWLPQKTVPSVIYLLRKCELQKSTCIRVLQPRSNNDWMYHWSKLLLILVARTLACTFSIMSRGHYSAFWILRAALDLYLGILVCPGWMTLWKGRHLLHPLKRSRG